MFKVSNKHLINILNVFIMVSLLLILSISLVFGKVYVSIDVIMSIFNFEHIKFMIQYFINSEHVLGPFQQAFTCSISNSPTNSRSSHRSCKKDALKNVVKLSGKHLCQSLFFNKVYFLQKLWQRCLPVIFYAQLRWLLLNQRNHGYPL